VRLQHPVRPRARSALGRAESVFAVVIVVVGALLAAGAVSGRAGQSSSARTSVCDLQFSTQLGPSAKGLCLDPVQITIPTSNASEITVPVMVLSPGSSTTVEILYSVGSESQGHIGPKVTVRPTDMPYWMSVPSGELSNRVVFSDAHLVFQTTQVLIYQYTVTASSDSTGYYAMLPPYYVGIYPALVVGAGSNHLNLTTLSTWAYTGVDQSAENTVPSTLVNTGGLLVTNVTLADVPHCLNPACNLISKSLF